MENTIVIFNYLIFSSVPHQVDSAVLKYFATEPGLAEMSMLKVTSVHTLCLLLY